LRSKSPSPEDRRKKKLRAYRAGFAGEISAVLLLFFKGYRIVGWRYKTGQGEVDILALKGRTLVAVEVKARARLEDAIEAVNFKNRERVERAALRFMAVHERLKIETLRFDVVAVRIVRGVVPVALLHLDNAWQSRT
jgi:putative endonuclease